MQMASWYTTFQSTISDPNYAYILLLIGIYGIFFELFHPGIMLPGIVGAICLLSALYAFQFLPVNYTGFTLLILGIVFMIIEVIVSSFGIIGTGGVIVFVLGSLFLFESNQPGFGINWQLILLMLLVSVGFILVVANLAIQSTRMKVITGKDALIGKTGEVSSTEADGNYVTISGELWKAQSGQPLVTGEKVRVTQVSGLLLIVEPLGQNNTIDNL